MVDGIEQGRLRLPDQPFEIQLRGQLEAQRQQVDGVADQMLVAIHRLAGGGNAHHHVVLTGQSSDQGGERSQQRREQAGATARAQAADRRDQVRVQHVILAQRGEAAPRRARAVGRKLKNRRAVGKARQPVALVLAELRTGRAQGLGQGVVGEILPVQRVRMPGVGRAQFTHDHPP